MDLEKFAGFAPGTKVGTSAWLTVDQPMIDQFGDATRDPDPMHIDPEWARENAPYGGTIAFGFLTVSLLTHLLHSAMDTKLSREAAGTGHFMNYGFNRLRLVSPVPTGAQVRGKFSTIDLRENERGRIIVTFQSEIEIEGKDRPALVAEWLAVWVKPETI
ncbi:MaoC family dehydratase [Pacificimonas sp. WHA3]|uniref:MaoC family dehydratase n=1 Tax=Pacificimonas pallii TaxID=2827236 RepID=A0ABS6SAU2_9SPHN|nr:MaoC family dehydratase [Pacificimonas pallii]MBV7255315.1 MaoC family dehydratase [Pacificimonas pallii]